jgi:hypothetical protein
MFTKLSFCRRYVNIGNVVFVMIKGMILNQNIIGLSGSESLHCVASEVGLSCEQSSGLVAT